MDNRGRWVQTNTYTEDQIKRVLIGSGVTIESEVGSDFIIFCPYHNNTRTPAGEVSKESGLFFCFSCQQTVELQELIMKMTGRSYFESIRFIKSKEKETNIEDLVNKKLYKPKEFIQYDELLIKRLNNQALDSPRAMRYFEGRQIFKRSVEKFSLGYSEKQDMVTIPVQSPDGMTIGFVARTVEGKEFKNTPGLPKSKILFNLHRVKQSNKVYVVESSFDAIRIDQVGFPAVATLGANVSSSQIELIKKYFNDVYIVSDNDNAGNTMANKLIDKIGSKAYIIKLNSKYKDIGDMLDSDIIELLQKSNNLVDQIFGTNR
jgi:DNA primase